MKKITLATVVCLLTVTVSAFADEKSAEKTETKAEIPPSVPIATPIVTGTFAVPDSERTQVRYVPEIKMVDGKQETEYRAVITREKQPSPVVATAVLPIKSIARTVFFPAKRFPKEQFAAFFNSSAEKMTGLGFLFSRFSEITVSPVFEGPAENDSTEGGVWLILYGPEATVTEIANVLEIIAQGAPDRQKLEGQKPEGSVAN